MNERRFIFTYLVRPVGFWTHSSAQPTELYNLRGADIKSSGKILALAESASGKPACTVEHGLEGQPGRHRWKCEEYRGRDAFASVHNMNLVRLVDRMLSKPRSATTASFGIFR